MSTRVVIPHDDLFHFTFQHVHHVVPWLRCVLPAQVAAAIDWARVAPASEKLHSLAQRLSVADLVFRTRCAGSRAAAWFVVEHKATEDPGVERQMLRYAVHLGDRARRARAAVPVVGVLLHHGERPFAKHSIDGAICCAPSTATRGRRSAATPSQRSPVMLWPSSRCRPTTCAQPSSDCCSDPRKRS